MISLFSNEETMLFDDHGGLFLLIFLGFLSLGVLNIFTQRHKDIEICELWIYPIKSCKV